MKIFGAGLAGLLAGCVFQTADIFEAAPPHASQHKALLRFRSRAVGDTVGIDFRPVMVRKGLWYQGAFHQPTIQFANWYSRKATGTIMDRSIWDLSSVERYIAPENLIEQLVERCGQRIHYNTPLTQMPHHDGGPYISTIPMSLMVQIALPTIDSRLADLSFKYAPIAVKRWRLKSSDVFQTVYIPDPCTTLYRVSITKDLVIAEYMGEADHYDFWKAFGLHEDDAEPLEVTKQRFGKIAPIEEGWRKKFMFDLTTTYNIYSLGRFATWRNILLDDVIKDIAVIKRLMAGSAYDYRKEVLA